MSRKADYTLVVPLCRDAIGHIGCHGFLHDIGRAPFETFAKINLADAAADTQRRWLAFQQEHE